MNKKIKINSRNSYKIGIQDKAYWLRDNSILEESEYKSRDCFMAHSHNCGGIEIRQIIPECEQSEFDYLEFGEWDGTHYCDESDTDNCDCSYENDGHYDAKLRIWFKFEGYDSESGELSFYLYLGGGNGDAPYFRTHSEQTIFEASFTCKSVEGLKRSANKHFKDLLKIIK
jgi:hypothetical protein